MLFMRVLTMNDWREGRLSKGNNDSIACLSRRTECCDRSEKINVTRSSVLSRRRRAHLFSSIANMFTKLFIRLWNLQDRERQSSSFLPLCRDDSRCVDLATRERTNRFPQWLSISSGSQASERWKCQLVSLALSLIGFDYILIEILCSTSRALVVRSDQCIQLIYLAELKRKQCAHPYSSKRWRRLFQIVLKKWVLVCDSRKMVSKSKVQWIVRDPIVSKHSFPWLAQMDSRGFFLMFQPKLVVFFSLTQLRRLRANECFLIGVSW